MRISLLASCVLLAALGMACAAPDGDWRLENLVPGNPSRIMTGTGASQFSFDNRTVYVSRGFPGRNIFATLEKHFPLEAWRGKRLRLTLRSRNEGAAGGEIMARMEKGNGAGFVSVIEKNNSASWETHQFVMDVPDDATDLALDVRALGAGVVWLDDIALAPAQADAVPGRSVRISYLCAGEEQEPCDPANAGRRAYLSWLSAAAGYQVMPLAHQSRTF